MAIEDVLESTSFQLEDTPIENSIAAELTGTEGMTDDQLGYDSPVPDDLAGDVEDYEAQHPDRKRQVPLAALHEERTKRREMQTQLEAQRQQAAALQAQLAQYQAAMQQVREAQQAQEAQIPAFNEDPEGHVNALREQFAQRLEQIQAGQQAQVQAQQQAVQVQQIRAELAQIGQSVQAEEAEFAARQPDYRDAGEFLQQQVAAQLRAQHPGATPEQLEFVQTLALGQVARQCKAQGLNPAEYLYQRAVARGWQGNGAAPAQRQAPAPALPPKAPRTLATVESSVEQGAKEFTLQNIAAMDDATFEATWNQMAKGNKPRFGF